MTLKRTTNNQPLYLFHQGTNYRSFDYLGAHFTMKNGKKAVIFRVWAPNADNVSVVGDFNSWDRTKNVLTKVSDNGVYETCVLGLKQFDTYKFAITKNNKTVLKADPYAFHAETTPKTASKIYNLNGFKWTDDEFIEYRTQNHDKPVNIYEVNLASFMRKDNGDYYSYRELAKILIKYVKKSGYTHIEIMPITEYPFDGSWGYQVTGYFAISSRFGTPKDFMYFVDCCHKNGISVILDWVPSHFPKDEHGLYEFDGSCCYEYQDELKKEHKEWGTRVFDWGKCEVQSFLISSAIFLFEKFHIDGLRVDAVSSMLYLDYCRKEGEWQPNHLGTNINLEAVSFLEKLNKAVFERFPNVMMIAEEATAYPSVTKPVYDGGLGFNFKWNMGWMNDTLFYAKCDPYFRSYHHDKLTFSLCYAFNENFILPISHDEVVHGKKSWLDKMPGEINDKFSQARTFNAYMMAHPGKKLTFMGNEYGQFKEWDYKEGLEFFMLKYPLHKKLYEYNRFLNSIYLSNSPLFEIENSWEGFKWISCDEKDNNVISFKRFNKNGDEIISVFNFSGSDYTNYRLGVDKGKYHILLNSNSKKFGGNGFFKGRIFNSVKKRAHGEKNSIKFNLPKFTALYFIKICDKKG